MPGLDSLPSGVWHVAVRVAEGFEVDRALTAGEYERAVDAIKAVASFRPTAHLFWMLTRNSDEFRVARSQIAARKGAGSPLDKPLFTEGIYVEANRRFMNFLTAARTLIDHSEYELAHSNNAPGAAAFKKATSAAYDSSVAYRFFYGLRNYAQHCGFPIGLIREHSEKVDSKAYKNDVTFYYFVKSELSRHNWNAKQRADLERMPAHFDVMPLFEKYLRHLNALQRVRIQVSPDVSEAATELRTLVAPLSDVKAIDCPVLLRIRKLGGTKSRLSFEQIPTEVVEHVLDKG